MVQKTTQGNDGLPGGVSLDRRAPAVACGDQSAQKPGWELPASGVSAQGTILDEGPAGLPMTPVRFQSEGCGGNLDTYLGLEASSHAHARIAGGSIATGTVCRDGMTSVLHDRFFDASRVAPACRRGPMDAVTRPGCPASEQVDAPNLLP